jgi:hypothetical protein
MSTLTAARGQRCFCAAGGQHAAPMSSTTTNPTTAADGFTAQQGAARDRSPGPASTRTGSLLRGLPASVFLRAMPAFARALCRRGGEGLRGGALRWRFCWPPLLGAALDLLPWAIRAGFPHPVVLMGRLIALLETPLRRLFPENAEGGRAPAPGAALVLCVDAGPCRSRSRRSFALRLAGGAVGVWARFALESFWCFQLLAAKLAARRRACPRATTALASRAICPGARARRCR